MNYRRVLLISELGTEPSVALGVLRRVAPEVEELHVVAHAPGPKFQWIAGDPGEAAPLVEQLRRSTAGAAPSVDLVLASGLDADAIANLTERAGVDLVMLDRPRPAALAVAGQVRKERSLPILCVRSGPRGQGPIREAVCLALDSREQAAVAAFLRDHGGPELHARVLSGPRRSTTGLRAALDMAGIRARVSLSGARRPGRGMDLLVFPRFPSRLLATGVWPAPILVLPPVPGPKPPRLGLDVPDLVLDGAVLRARLLHPAGPGRHVPIPDQEVAIVARGTVASVAAASSGYAEIPADLQAGAIAVFRMSERRDGEALAAIEAEVRVIRPERPLILFDAGVSKQELRALATRAATTATAFLAVRLRPTRSCGAIRARLANAGLPSAVIDASAVLDEGVAHDVGPELDGVRLARVAARMRGAGGYRVVAIVHRAANRPHTFGFAALKADEVPGWRAPRAAGAGAPVSAEARLEATTGASLIPGGQVELELDNATARRWLLEAIAAARDRVHFQVYMAADDDVGALVEGALADAGSRGVRVRVVVDSLHGLEGSLGAHNPLLERLRGRPGVELRVLRPVTGIPSLDDLKRRDHRKLAVVDGAVALLGGRNLSHEYYTGFDEVTLTPESTWRLVPWLDAGARVRGPAVAALERSFRDAWVQAGGKPFAIETPTPAGGTSVRVVVHQGLQDARTLEAYLSLIDGARSHVTTVNGFPMTLEIQHALLRALKRGVRVRSLVGSLTPTHNGKPFRGPWSSARIAATSFVHSRIDAIVGAGGEAYQFAVPPQPGWDPGLGVVCPHVHAKLMTVDGRVCTVGSANLDITAGYWESELMLVVEDPAIAATVEARIDHLIEGSMRFDRDDPAWRQSARRREWMRHWPGVLSI
jgi:phosphatidylserine/phosphatidylglycerophosphate/cardiolipin synthase-like enzyme